jgi:hypothetical protein
MVLTRETELCPNPAWTQARPSKAARRIFGIFIGGKMAVEFGLAETREGILFIRIKLRYNDLVENA